MRRAFTYLLFAGSAATVLWAVAIIAGGDSSPPPAAAAEPETTAAKMKMEAAVPAVEPRPVAARVENERVDAEETNVEHHERIQEIVRDLEDRQDALVAEGATEAARTVQKQIDRLKASNPEP